MSVAPLQCLMDGSLLKNDRGIIAALRGAARAKNSEKDMAAAVLELYDGLLRLNGLTEEDIVSLCFSLTAGLNALNPAAALRRAGRAKDTAMMVFQEAAVKGGLPRVIRLMIYAYTAKLPVRHLYIRGAEVLRPDRAAGGSTGMGKL